MKQPDVRVGVMPPALLAGNGDWPGTDIGCGLTSDAKRHLTVRLTEPAGMQQFMIGKSAFAIMALLAASVALYSLRFYGVPAGHWLDVDAGIREVIARVPVQALTHMLIAPIALLLGPFQFYPKLRTRYPQVHRWSGRVYVTACVVAGIAGLAASPYASGGPVAGLGFGILAVLWVSTTLGAWRAAVRRRFALHRLLMRFSYAMTFGAVTLRLQIPLGFVLGYSSYSAMSVWLAYTSWIPNVVAVAIYSMVERKRPTRAASLLSDHRGRSEAAFPGRPDRV